MASEKVEEVVETDRFSYSYIKTDGEHIIPSYKIIDSSYVCIIPNKSNEKTIKITSDSDGTKTIITTEVIRPTKKFRYISLAKQVNELENTIYLYDCDCYKYYLSEKYETCKMKLKESVVAGNIYCSCNYCDKFIRMKDYINHIELIHPENYNDDISPDNIHYDISELFHYECHGCDTSIGNDGKYCLQNWDVTIHHILSHIDNDNTLLACVPHVDKYLNS